MSKILDELKNDEIGTTEIWYWKDIEYSFKVNRCYEEEDEDEILDEKIKPYLPKTLRELQQTHEKLGTTTLKGADEIFFELQGERWSPNGEARDFIKQKGLIHTSFSVGDIIKMNKHLFICLPIEWYHCCISIKEDT